MSKIEEVYNALKKIDEKSNDGVTASELSKLMNLDRGNVSRYLNQLFKEGMVKKSEGYPVKYSCTMCIDQKNNNDNKKSIKKLKEIL